MSIIETDLGAATAYAEAVEAGYKGTREEFGKLLANFVGSATEVEENRTAVEKIKEELKNTVNVFDQHVSDKTDEANKEIKEATDDVKGKAIESVESARDEGKSAIAAAVEEGKKNFVTDKNLEEEGRAADAKAVGDVVGQLKEELTVLDTELSPVFNDYYAIKSVDISMEIQKGYYDNVTFFANNSYRSIKHVCSSGEKYCISTYLLIASKFAVVTFYDKNNTIIARYGGYYDGQTENRYFKDYECVAPRGSVYFIANSFYAESYPFTLKKYELNKKEETKEYRDTSWRYLEHLEIKKGYYDNGTFYPNGSYQSTTVDCIAGERYKINTYMYGAAKMPVVQFYDKNNNLLSTTEKITTDCKVVDYEIEIPIDCTWLVATNYKIEDNIDFNIRKYISGKKPLWQKNYIAIGDSITYISEGWRPWFNRLTGANEVVCTAVSGATICDYADTVLDGIPTRVEHSNTFSNQVQSILNNPPVETIDFIIIAGGTNDHADASEFDNGVKQFVNDGTYIDIDIVDRRRYDGAMRWIAEKLWTIFPNAVIFWCTPIQGAEKTRQTWVQIRKCDYIKEVASHLACPVIDATRNSGIYGRYENANAKGKYLNDGLHPNMDGRRKLGSFYAKEIINYYSYEID